MAMFIIACAGETGAPTAAPTPTAELLATTSAPHGRATEVATIASAPTETQAATPTVAVQETQVPTEAPPEPATPKPMPSDAATVFTLGEGTVARYRVEEELASTGFFVAVGETTDVAGSIAFDSDGAVIAEESRLAVQAATLRTDSNRRDGYVRSRTLETDTYPEVVFQPTSVDNLEWPPATNFPVAFTLTGDLTIKNRTEQVVWDAQAVLAESGTMKGLAIVEFTFDDFGMDKPRVAVVLSVDDTIRLELDFTGTITAP